MATGLTQQQIDQLKGFGGIDQGLLSQYESFQRQQGNNPPPAARGDDYAPAFTAAGGPQIAQETGASMTSVGEYISGGRSYSALQSEGASMRGGSLLGGPSTETSGMMSADAWRASNIGSTLGQSVTAQGARSSRVLSDKEIDDLAKRGYREGDFVPGEGVLLPNGTFDTTKLDQLNAFEAQAMEIQKGIDRLREQEKNQFKGVVSDESVVQAEAAAVAKLKEESPIFSRAEAILDKQDALIQSQLDAEIRAAELEYEAQRVAMQNQQEREVGGLSVGLAAAGGYLGFTGSGTGVMLTLTKSHRAELQMLANQRDRAIADARRAAAQQQFNVVREKAALVERLEQEAYARQEKYQSEMKAAADKQNQEARERQTEQDVYTLIQSGIRSVDGLFAALGGQVPVATIQKLLTGFLPDSGNGFKFSATNTASLLGTGLSRDDIVTLQDYVNDNGYDENIRGMLTASQRAAADKIFRPTTGGGAGAGGGFTAQELRKLEQAGLINAPRQDQLDFLYGNTGSKAPATITNALTGLGIPEDEINLIDRDIKEKGMYDWLDNAILNIGMDRNEIEGILATYKASGDVYDYMEGLYSDPNLFLQPGKSSVVNDLKNWITNLWN